MPDTRIVTTYPSYHVARLEQIVALKGYKSKGELLRDILRKYLEIEDEED